MQDAPQIVGELQTMRDDGFLSDALLRAAVKKIESNDDRFDWVGVYLLNDEGNELWLHNYVGEPTEHAKIPVRDDVVVIDSRPKARMYDVGHIPGALNISLEEVRPDHPQLREFDAFIVYGDEYNEPIALAMAKRMLANGYGNVHTLRGGYSSWQRAGHDTVTSE